MAEITKKRSDEDILIELMKNYRLLRTDNGVYVNIERNMKKCNIDLRGNEFRIFIKSQMKELEGHFPSDRTLYNCIDYIENMAYGQELQEAKYRVAETEDGIVYDLQDGQCVVVDKNGWYIKDNNYTMFVKSKDQLSQVKPIKSDNGLNRLDKYLNISEEEKLLLKVYIVSCFNPKITIPSVNINGTNGSGKSTLSRIIKKIIDPSCNEVESLPESINDLRIRLNLGYYAAFDNLSNITAKQSDFLCSVITGVTYSNRKQYTNQEIDSSRIRRGMCLNGISNFIHKADLAERVLFIRTKLFNYENKLTDDDIWNSFNKDLPYILGGIFDLLSKTLLIQSSVKVKKLQRLADFHKFGYAIAQIMGDLGNEFDKVLSENKERQMEITCDNAMLIRLLYSFLKENDGEWNDTTSLLYKSLKNYIQEKDDSEYDLSAFPKTVNHFSRRLKEFESALASKGIMFEIRKNGDGNSKITITIDWIDDVNNNEIKRVPIIADMKKRIKLLADLNIN